MPNFRIYNQSQGIFRTIIPNDLLEEKHPARIIDKVIENLNLERIYAFYSDEGNTAYHPLMMLKVLFYSYYTGVFSCRNMWGALKRQADYIFLSGDQVPDFRTINDFRKRHIKELPDLFTQVVMICEKLNMLGFEHLAIDGQKIHGNANFTKSMNQERLNARYKRIKEGIQKLLEKEPAEDSSLEKRNQRLNTLRKEERKIKGFINVFNKLRDEAEKKDEDFKKNMTDPDANVMRHKNRKSVPSYNHQSAIDDKCGVTVAINTKTTVDEPKDLIELTDKASKNTAGLFKNVTADAAFGSMENYKTFTEKREENFFVPDKHFDAAQNEEDSSLKYSSDYFMRCDDGTVVCPENEEMALKQEQEFDGYTKTTYISTECDTCEKHEFCTKAEFRTLTIDSREKYQMDMRKKLLSEKGREIYSRRQAIVEPTHGHDQKNRGWIQHHLRGLPKATLEFMLIRIGANLGKIVNYRAAEVLATL